MSDPPPFLAPGVLGLLAVLVLGVRIAGIVRDSDEWVIARGVTTGKIQRLRRFLRNVRHD